jgi:hypothetical protein
MVTQEFSIQPFDDDVLAAARLFIILLFIINESLLVMTELMKVPPEPEAI